jgi:hypothetical protein
MYQRCKDDEARRRWLRHGGRGGKEEEAWRKRMHGGRGK